MSKPEIPTLADEDGAAHQTGSPRAGAGVAAVALSNTLERVLIEAGLKPAQVAATPKTCDQVDAALLKHVREAHGRAAALRDEYERVTAPLARRIAAAEAEAAALDRLINTLRGRVHALRTALPGAE